MEDSVVERTVRRRGRVAAGRAKRYEIRLGAMRGSDTAAR